MSVGVALLAGLLACASAGGQREAGAGRPTPAELVPLSLADCLNEAVAHNPRLAAALSQVDLARASVRIARSQGGLHANIGGKAAVQGPVPVVQLPGGQPTQVVPAFDPSIGVTFELPIDLNDRIKAEKEGARAGVEAAEAQFEQARDQLTFETVRAYFGVLRAEALAESAEGKVSAAEEAERVASARLEAGMAKPLESTQARNAAEQAREGLARAENARADALASLNTALGRPTDALTELSKVLLRPERVPDPLESIEIAERSRPELAAALAELRRAAAQIKAADGADEPSVAVTGGVQAQRASLIRSPITASIGLGFSWPVADHGRADGLQDQAEAQHDRAELMLETTRDAIELQVQQAVLMMADADLRTRVALGLRQEAEQALADAQSAVAGGQATELVLRQAMAALGESWALERLAHYDLSVAYAAWARATGNMGPAFFAGEATE